MAVKPIQLSHANIFVRDVDRAEKFYREVLGLTVTNRMPKASFLAANEATSHEIALMKVADDAPGPERGRVGLNHIAWQMATFDDLKEIYRRLQEYGAEIVRISDHSCSFGIYFKDPDGNENEAYYELPKDQWPDPVDGNIFKGEKPFPWSLDDETPADSPRMSVSLTEA